MEEKWHSSIQVLAIIGMAFFSPVIIPALFLGGLLYDFFNSKLPPGIDQPLKLRFYHSVMITTMISVSSLS